MKVGMIFECGPDGADLQMCKHLARLLHPDIEIAHVTLDNKSRLVLEWAALHQQELLENWNHCRRAESPAPVDPLE